MADVGKPSAPSLVEAMQTAETATGTFSTIAMCESRVGNLKDVEYQLTVIQAPGVKLRKRNSLA
jgi:hypothetical protein